jgi:hypothetical protein
MRRVAVFVGLALGLSECGLMPSEANRDQPAPEDLPMPDVQEPPPLVINDVAGRPVSWCWGEACVDGFVNSPVILPAVNPPFEVILPAASRIEGVAAVGPQAAGGRTVQVPFEGTQIEELPADAVMLNVFIRFDDGGDASYYWALNRTAD